VTSPTFVIARVHDGGRLPMVHVDAYRLGGAADLAGEVDALDLDVTLDEAVTLVEWGEGVVSRLGAEYLEIRISRGVDSERRVIEFVPHGGGWNSRITANWPNSLDIPEPGVPGPLPARGDGTDSSDPN
jgi:tRNA threonylcarbamoyladenosine biosynthesis protein TsaE